MATELTTERMRMVFTAHENEPLDPTGCMCPVEVVLREIGAAADPGACRGYWVDYAKRKREEIPNPPVIAEFIGCVDRRFYAGVLPMGRITGKDALVLLDLAEQRIKMGDYS